MLLGSVACNGMAIALVHLTASSFGGLIMKRKTSFLAVFVLLSMSAPLIFAQGLQSQPSLAPPPETLGPRLIVWSQTQKLQPIPQPLLPPDRTIQQRAQPADPSDQQPAAQTFTGTIVKNGSTYVLKLSRDFTYQLNDQDLVKQYEGKQVKVTGALDAKGGWIQTTSVELLSS
jgi:hypothetical protein